MILVTAVWMVALYNVVDFFNGRSVVEYKVYNFDEKGKKQYATVKQFYETAHKPMIRPAGTLVIISGDQRPNGYKDRETGEWVDKGIYIEVRSEYGFIDLSPQPMTVDEAVSISNQYDRLIYSAFRETLNETLKLPLQPRGA